MPVMTVHTAIRDKPDKMQPPAARLRECFLQNLAPLQLAVDNRFVNSSQILVNNPAGTKVEMPDFGVTHLPGRQADILSTRAYRRPRILAIELVMKRCARQ